MMDLIITQQAAIIAYANDFTVLMYLTLAAIPLVVFIGGRGARPAAAESHAFE
jgi:DHA2 family multidrug resistance protein